MYDILIVGAGPAGLTAGIYARTRKMNVIVIEAKKAGGQLDYLYPLKCVANYPSYPEITANELAKKIIAHALASGLELKENEVVTEISDKGEYFTVRTSKNSYDSKVIILAIGMGLFEPRKLGVQGEDKFTDKGVYYLIPDAQSFKGKKALFVGGGNSALEMALSVCNLCSQITLIHRKDCFRADESNVEAVNKSNIKVMFNTELKEIQGANRVEKAIVFNNQSSQETVLEVDAVVINVGFSPNLGMLEKWNLELEEKKIKVDSQMRTSRKGIFACGDIVTYPGKYMQILTACGEGATAANSAYKYIKKPYWA